MDDVRVYRDSPKPAQLGAFAFTRGTEIHIGPRSDQHLAHEAWHVVQQKQGRVTATERLESVQINANADLEREADQASAKLAVWSIEQSAARLESGRITSDVVQRQKADKAPPSAPPPPRDVALVLNPGLKTQAKVIAPGATIVEASSLDELAKKLKKIKGPVNTLYFVAHMLDDGNIEFKTPGKQVYVSAQMVADKVKRTLEVGNIDFRGCSIGQAPVEMQTIAGALKATRAIGSTCSLVEQKSNPVVIEFKGKKLTITKPEQLKDETVKAAFKNGLKKLREQFGGKKKNCLINDTEDGYFKSGGKLLAYWANPESMADQDAFDDNKSICYKDLKVEQVDVAKPPVINAEDCKLIEIGAKKP